MSSKIGVGIIGASPDRGWALAAHIPALRALPEYEIRAVSTSRRETAERSAKTLGVELAFDNHHDLLARPEVDLAVVAVNVTRHDELARAAIASGKNVFCDWPLGRSLQEAEGIADAARRSGQKTVIGLQGRFAPAVQYLRDLVNDGYFGKLLGTSIVGAGAHEVFAGVLAPEHEFMADARNGGTLLTVPAAHAIDILCFALGDFRTISSTIVTRRDHAIRTRDNAAVPTTLEDQIAFSGELENGALASVHYRGGSSKGPDFVWEISGTEGDVILSLEEGFANIAELTIRGARGKAPLEILPVPTRYHLAPEGLPVPARNVAALYAQFARDLAEGTSRAPDLELAVRRHRVVDAIQRANATGVRQVLA